MYTLPDIKLMHYHLLPGNHVGNHPSLIFVILQLIEQGQAHNAEALLKPQDKSFCWHQYDIHCKCMNSSNLINMNQYSQTSYEGPVISKARTYRREGLWSEK